MSNRGIAVDTAMDSVNKTAESIPQSEPQHLSPVSAKRQQRKPLRESIDQALERYFQDLDGTEPNDLYAMVLQEVEQPLLSRVMHYTNGNQSRAAEILGINRSTLRKKLRQHGLVD